MQAEGGGLIREWLWLHRRGEGERGAILLGNCTLRIMGCNCKEGKCQKNSSPRRGRFDDSLGRGSKRTVFSAEERKECRGEEGLARFPLEKRNSSRPKKKEQIIYHRQREEAYAWIEKEPPFRIRRGALDQKRRMRRKKKPRTYLAGNQIFPMREGTNA